MVYFVLLSFPCFSDKDDNELQNILISNQSPILFSEESDNTKQAQKLINFPLFIHRGNPRCRFTSSEKISRQVGTRTSLKIKSSIWIWLWKTKQNKWTNTKNIHVDALHLPTQSVFLNRKKFVVVEMDLSFRKTNESWIIKKKIEIIKFTGFEWTL